MTKWALITKDFDFVTQRAKNGTVRGMMAFKASPEPQPVTQAQLDAILAGGKDGVAYGTEVPAPEDKKVTKGGQAAPKEAEKAAS